MNNHIRETTEKLIFSYVIDRENCSTKSTIISFSFSQHQDKISFLNIDMQYHCQHGKPFIINKVK